MTGQLDATVVRGRWSNARTARIYINEGAVELDKIRLSSQQQKTLDKGAADFDRWFG